MTYVWILWFMINGHLTRVPFLGDVYENKGACEHMRQEMIDRGTKPDDVFCMKRTVYP